MRTFLLGSVDLQRVTAGRVSCVETGRDVDIDECLGCQKLVRLESSDDGESIRCRRQPLVSVAPEI